MNRTIIRYQENQLEEKFRHKIAAFKPLALLLAKNLEKKCTTLSNRAYIIQHLKNSHGIILTYQLNKDDKLPYGTVNKILKGFHEEMSHLAINITKQIEFSGNKLRLSIEIQIQENSPLLENIKTNKWQRTNRKTERTH
ncbi:MAG: hypothetical protein ACOCUH_02165 [Bacteriovoracia bacterium]